MTRVSPRGTAPASAIGTTAVRTTTQAHMGDMRTNIRVYRRSSETCEVFVERDGATASRAADFAIVHSARHSSASDRDQPGAAARRQRPACDRESRSASGSAILARRRRTARRDRYTFDASASDNTWSSPRWDEIAAIRRSFPCRHFHDAEAIEWAVYEEDLKR